MKFRAFRTLAATLVFASAAAFAVPAAAQAQDGRYIVKFRAGRGAAAQAALRAAGARVVLDLDAQGAAAAHIPAAALNGLARNPNIEYIEADVLREPYALWSNVSSAGEITPYGIQMVQANKVVSPNAAGVTLCIIDSGYSQQHADLRDSNVTAKLTDSGSGSWNKDSCGHGSHVAGTVAAISGNATGVVGANPGVSLHIVKVFGNDTLVEDGSCNWTYSSTLVSALNSCRAAGADVVSMSLGGGARSRTEERAFADANAAGVLSIAAAGNAGNNSTSFPAGYPSVMSVAAVDANEARASFSQRNSDVEIAAPGVAVLSTTPWQDSNTLGTSSTLWSGGRLDGAPRGSISGAIVGGGRCTASGSWAGRVVLCERGDNSFADKVAKVQAGGGVAAVIYNNVASDPTCGVFSGTLGTTVTTSIRAITLSCSDGAAAVSAAGTQSTVQSSFVVPESSYEAWDGTSMATPHVSAVAALIWSCNTTKTNQQIRNALTSTALDRGAAGRDTSFGFGIVQAKTALQSLGLGSCTVKP